MLKVKLLVFFCLLRLTALAQLPVRLSGTLHGYNDGALVSLVSYQGYLIDTTRLLKGRFSFKESIPGGDYYVVRIRAAQRPAVKDSLLIYLDAGKMNVNLTRNKSWKTRFSGSLYARQLDSFYKSVQSGSSWMRISPHQVSSWILSHLTSPVSVFALDRYLRPNPKGIRWSAINSLYRRLDPRALNNILALRLGLTIERLNTLDSGNFFPSFELPDSTGKLTGLSKNQGRYLLIDFWASWCGPCRDENPHMKQIASRYAGKSLQVVSISLDKNTETWRNAIQSDQLNWTQLIDRQFPNSALTKGLNLKMIPADFLLNPEGKIIAKNLFGEALDTELDHLLLH